MKKIVVPAVLIFALISGFISCQKDKINELPLDADPADTLLSRIITWDSLEPHKDVEVIEFKYDDQQRVIEIKVNWVDSVAGNPVITDEQYYNYYYNGTEKQPFRSFGWNRVFSAELEIFHFYDAGSRLIKDSFPSGDDQFYILNEYTYHPDKLILIKTYFDNGDITNEQDSCVISSGNIVKAFFAFPPGIGHDVFECTYDDKINPLSKLSIAATRVIDGYFAFDKLITLSPGYSRNNIIHRLDFRGSLTGVPQVNEYNYVYNSNNLPVYYAMESSSGNSDAIRTVFEYTH